MSRLMNRIRRNPDYSGMNARFGSLYQTIHLICLGIALLANLALAVGVIGSAAVIIGDSKRPILILVAIEAALTVVFNGFFFYYGPKPGTCGLGRKTILWIFFCAIVNTGSGALVQAMYSQHGGCSDFQRYIKYFGSQAICIWWIDMSAMLGLTAVCFFAIAIVATIWSTGAKVKAVCHRTRRDEEMAVPLEDLVIPAPVVPADHHSVEDEDGARADNPPTYTAAVASSSGPSGSTGSAVASRSSKTAPAPWL